ncbi:MAG: hypothetical protein RIS85_464, partial [Pseudomonadota bacterium]
YIIGRRIGQPKSEAPVRMRGVGEPAGRRRALTESHVAEADAPQIEAAVPAVDVPRHSIMAVEDLGAPLDAPFEHEQAFAPFAEVAEVEDDQPHDSAAAEPVLAEPARAGTEENDLADQPVEAVEAEESPLILDIAIEDADEPVTVEAMELVSALQPTSAVSAPSAPAPAPAVPFLQAHPVASTPLARTPLESLGLVQLVERLALAMSERMRRRHVAVPVAEPEAPVQQAEPMPRLHSGLHSGDNAGLVGTPASAIAADAPLSSPWSQAPGERVVSLRPAGLQPFAPAVYDDARDADTHDDDLDLPRFLRMPEAAAEAFSAPDASAWAEADNLASPVEVEAVEAEIEDEDGDEDEESAFDEDFDDGDAFAEELPEAERPEPEVAEHRYSSLLGMAPTAARREPVRIDDGLALDAVDADAIEPVVVFPGQTQNAQANRPFDGPSIIPVQGSPLAAPGRAAPSAQIDALEMPEMPEMDIPATAEGTLPDAEEADRALRAALATLQRMTAQG